MSASGGQGRYGLLKAFNGANFRGSRPSGRVHLVLSIGSRPSGGVIGAR
jgi:hypothetical protein